MALAFSASFYLFVGMPFALTIWNIVVFILCVVKKRDRKYAKFLETAAMAVGIGYLFLYFDLGHILLVPWHVQLSNNEVHSMIAPETFPTMVVLAALAFLGYLFIRFVPAGKQPPLASAIAIAAVYIGMILCIVWCIQTFGDWILMLLPVNCLLLFFKAVYILVREKSNLIQQRKVSLKYKKLSEILNDATKLPWVGLLLLIPLLGLVVAVLFLFGQEPDSIIKAWTETADWTFSQETPPQNVQFDEHYLCTVAAGGHRKVVKPVRTGTRHGHRVVVNRQLCVANAFEQVLEEKTPAAHRVIRCVYDRTGYPLSKRIHSKALADGIYFIMKPLEWIFLMVLYMVDVHPENRIALQYPHAAKPEGY